MDTNNKVLLVEDDDMIRDLYKMQLDKNNIFTDAVATAEDAQNLLSQKQYDLLLLDIMLPGIDGVKFLAKIKSEPKNKDLKVVLLTNLSQTEIIKEAFANGALDYILKIKYTPDQIVTKVKGYLQTSALQPPPISDSTN